MEIEEFKERCAGWRGKSWNKGNLMGYWRQAGLTVGQIFGNEETESYT